MKWSEEKIQRQKEYFKEQRVNPTGNFTEFVVRTFYFVYRECQKTQNGLVKGNITNSRKLVKSIYDGIYEQPDHMGHAVVDDCVRNLKELGYIGFRKIGDTWYIFVKNQLDFLKPGEHEEYMRKFAIEDNIKC